MSAIQQIARHFASGQAGGPAHRQLPLGRRDFQDAELQAAAVLVGLLERDGDERLLLTRRAQHLRHHGGQVSFPGGRLEAADSGPVAAALRETFEETGIPPEVIDVHGTLPRQVTISGFTVTPVVATIRELVPMTLDSGEVEAVFEVPLAFLLDPANQRSVERHFGQRSLTMPEWHYRDYRIWGATAWMIRNVINILKT